MEIVSPGCTTGPFFPREFSDGSEDLTHREGLVARGEHIWLAGRVLELDARPTWNMVLEIWQPDSAGILRHPLDPHCAQADPGFWGWGRARTAKDGWYRFKTVLPGVLGIGLTRRLVTTIFFSAAADPVLQCVPAALRPRLIAQRDSSLDRDGIPAYRFDVILRGEGETPFFID
jgi:protocatechuate 3,4-dioxygenase beta subunit